MNRLPFLSVVTQDYVTETHNAYVILGNDALLKCTIPSFVADFVSVSAWVSGQGEEFHRASGQHGSSILRRCRST